MWQDVWQKLSGNDYGFVVVEPVVRSTSKGAGAALKLRGHMSCAGMER